jgi:membrane protease YdiL (CAAX protease family)
VRNNSTWALSPPSPTNWAKESWNPLFTVLTFLGVIVVFIAAQTVFAIIGFANHSIDPAHLDKIPGTVSIWLEVCSFTPVAIFLLLVLQPLAKRSFRELGFRAPTGGDVRTALLGTLAMLVLVDGLGSLIASVTHLHDTEAAIALLQQMKTPFQRIFFFTFACVLAPFYEELAFRGFILNALSKYMPLWYAIVLSGLLFGALHAVSGPATQFLTVGLPLAVGGVVLAYVYTTTKCFWANVITHATFNAVSVASFFIFHIS